MGFHYRIYDNEKAYFITITVVEWVELFIRRNHSTAVVESLEYCIKNKGLELFAWCLMPNHLHMIARGKEGHLLSNIVRDFKRHTSKKLADQITNEPESRRRRLIETFRDAALTHPKEIKLKIWQDGYHPVELYSRGFTKQKLNYIHQNPVEQLLVEHPWDYLFSSARDYAGKKGMLDVVLLEM